MSEPESHLTHMIDIALIAELCSMVVSGDGSGSVIWWSEAARTWLQWVRR